MGLAGLTVSSAIVDTSARPGASCVAMSTTETTGPEGPERGPEPGPIRYSVAVAAARLGISERAVRKRIQAGTLAAEPHGRTYWVYLQPGPEGPEGPEPGPVPLDRNGPEPGPDRALSAERETAVVNLVREMIEPFVKELGETKEQLGRVTAERDALQCRVDALEARRRSAQDTAVLRVIQPDHTPETATGARQKKRQRRWWLRLFGVDE